MMLLDLADAAFRSGLTVVEEPDWRTRGHGSMTAVRSIICHHTAGPATGDAPSLADHYGVPYARVLGHREVATPVGRKVDPNFDMAAFRAAVASSEDDMPTADEIAAAVLARRIRNFHGDTVTLEQIVVATEQRIADAQNQLRSITDALGDRLVDDKA